ncbi:hypothetical protein DPEC_G00062100 [Dallia pectoralis]|uniref:Uncharacterized protein n=1 Tax=Dallia pectoralis TaxID=75939 RepID=A0ACC2H795_DALPE|nr:hypothetical protein DPEC_G00062100 [Dallia pectoralis]
MFGLTCFESGTTVTDRQKKIIKRRLQQNNKISRNTVHARPSLQQSSSPQDDIPRSPQMHYEEMGYPSNAEDRAEIPISQSPLSHAQHATAKRARTGMQQTP